VAAAHTDPIEIVTGEAVGGGGTDRADPSDPLAPQPQQDPDDPGIPGFPFTAQDLGEMGKDSYDRLNAFRVTRQAMLQQYVGPHYPGGSSGDDYSNLVQQTIEGMLQTLGAEEIKVSATPATLDLKLEAMAQARKLERTAEEIDLAGTHGEAVLDALLGPFGVVWVGLKAGSDQCAINDRRFNPGLFTAATVDLDDFVIDQQAKKRTQALFMGHRTRLMRSEAKAAMVGEGQPLFDSEVIDGCVTISTGDEDRGDTQEMAGRSGDPYDTADMIELWQLAVYIGGEVWCCVLDRLDAGAKFARKPWKWWGNERGPYLFLSFLEVPNNAIPLAFVNRIADLNKACARIARKAVSDFIEAKDVNVYRPGEQDLAEAVRKAAHGSWVMGDPSAITTISNSGTLQKLFPVLEWVKGLANDATGGTQLQAGAKDNSKTATGASIIAGKQQQREDFMQGKSKKFLTEIAQACSWYIFNDPFLRGSVTQRLPGGAHIELAIDPELRESDWSKTAIKIDAMAGKKIDPAVRGSQFIQLCGTLPSLAALGPDAFTKIMSIAARELDQPDLDEINPDPSMLQARQMELAQTGQETQQNRGQEQPGIGAARPGAMQLGQTRSAMAGGAPPMTPGV